jgi:hypothetical protein
VTDLYWDDRRPLTRRERIRETWGHVFALYGLALAATLIVIAAVVIAAVAELPVNARSIHLRMAVQGRPSPTGKPTPDDQPRSAA